MDPGRRRRAVRRFWTAVAAALALPLIDARRRHDPRQAAAVQCSVDYKTNDWGSGFTADLTLTNRGTAAIDGWTLTYAYAGNQKLTNGWNGTWSQAGKTVTVRNASYNGDRRRRAPPSRTGAQFTLQRHQRRADQLRGQRHELHRRPPAADHRADQPGRGRGLLAGRRRAARGDRGGRGRRDDQQGRVLRRHHAAGHRHERAVHALAPPG